MPPTMPYTRMTMRPLASGDSGAVRAILEATGWAAQHIGAAVHNAEVYASAPHGRAGFAATAHDGDDTIVAGYVLVELHMWNMLAQIQSLAVHPHWRRQGCAGALVVHAETWAHRQGARGVYVDTPTANLGGCAFYMASGYRAAYVMPRYYDDHEDGITFQKFFASGSA